MFHRVIKFSSISRCIYHQHLTRVPLGLDEVLTGKGQDAIPDQGRDSTGAVIMTEHQQAGGEAAQAKLAQEATPGAILGEKNSRF